MSRVTTPWVALGALVLAGTGCGLKAPLEMPEKSGNIVIRAPQGPTQPGAPEPGPAEATAPGAPTPPAAPSSATPSSTKPGPPKDEVLPPPPLPGGNPGASRGG